jgi:hypothetical protein
MTTKRSRYLLATAALAAALTAGACSTGGSGSSDSSGGSDTGLTAAEPTPATDDDLTNSRNDLADEAAMAEADGAPAEPADPVKEPIDPQQQAVISTGTVSLEADDVGDARFEVQKIIDRAGGSITEQETTTDDDGELDTARIVLRVPSQSFTETVDALEKVASLSGSTTGSDDVTTEVIDVDARIRAQERSVRRIEALLSRAGTLREIISIESDLSRRQADLDSLKSRQKWLEDQTSRSTITVHLERTDVDEDKDEEETRDGFLGGLSAGWDAFVDGAGGALMVIGFLLPWTLALGVILLPVWLWLRGNRRRRTPAAAAGPQ